MRAVQFSKSSNNVEIYQDIIFNDNQKLSFQNLIGFTEIPTFNEIMKAVFELAEYIRIDAILKDEIENKTWVFKPGHLDIKQITLTKEEKEQKFNIKDEYPIFIYNVNYEFTIIKRK